MKLLSMAREILLNSRRKFVRVSQSQQFYSTAAESANLNVPKSKEVESAILSLKKKLNLDDLTRVLDSVSDVQSAAAIFRWSSRQRSFQHTVQTCAHIIWRCASGGNSEKMEAFLKEMVKFNLMDVDSSFVLLIESFCANQKVEEALKVLQIARSANLRLPVSTCNHLLHLLVSNENVNIVSVMFVYKEMVKADILPDVDTLNYLIKSLCENGRLDSALMQFRKMKQKQCRPNSWTFELIISSLCSCGRTDEALEIWKQMLLFKCRPLPEFYARVIPLFCRANKLNESIELFKMMKDDMTSPDSYLYDTLIECLSSNLRLDVAVKMLEEMSDLGITPSARNYTHIVNGYCKLGHLHDAKKFLDWTNDCSAEPYDALLGSFCDLNRFQEAIRLLEKMFEKNIGDVSSSNIIIDGLCKRGNVRRALEVICRMVVRSNLPDRITYSSLITGYCRNSEFEIAFKIFEQKSIQEMCLNRRSCSHLIEGLCHAKKIQEAAEVFYHLICKGDSPSLNSLDVLISGICDTGKLKEALKVRLLASCNGICLSSSSYTPIIIKLLNLNKERYILPVLTQMLVEGCSLDLTTYCILIHGLCISGRIMMATDLFNRMVDDGLLPESDNLERIIEGFAKCLSLKLIAHSLEKLLESGATLDPLACNVVISSLMKEGQKAVACKFLDWMLERGWVPDPDTHILLIGNIDSERKDCAIQAYDADTDVVRNILDEGLNSYY